MAGTIDDLVLPAIEFSRGHLVVVRDVPTLRSCTRAGVRSGWFDELLVVDATLRRWTVSLVGTQANGALGWITGRLVAELDVRPAGTVGLEDLRRQVVEVLERDEEFWDADGQLERRFRAVRKAPDARRLIEALEAREL